MNKVEISDLRKKMKAIGFNVKTKSLSIGINATITKDGMEMPDFFNGEGHRNQWLPAILILQSFSGCTFVSNGRPTFGLQRYCNNLKG